MGFVEYHIEQTTKAPPVVLGEERQAVRDIIAEYEDVFTGIGKLKGVTVKLHVEMLQERFRSREGCPSP